MGLHIGIALVGLERGCELMLWTLVHGLLLWLYVEAIHVDMSYYDIGLMLDMNLY